MVKLVPKSNGRQTSSREIISVGVQSWLKKFQLLSQLEDAKELGRKKHFFLDHVGAIFRKSSKASLFSR